MYRRLLQILYIVKDDPKLWIVLTLFLNYRLVPRCPVFCGVGSLAPELPAR